MYRQSSWRGFGIVITDFSAIKDHSWSKLSFAKVDLICYLGEEAASPSWCARPLRCQPWGHLQQCQRVSTQATEPVKYPQLDHSCKVQSRPTSRSQKCFRCSDLKGFFLVRTPSVFRNMGAYSPELSGKTAVSPAVKSNVRALELPVKTVARAWPWWKYSHSSA